jgi:toxin ParE1/3/4
VKIWILSPRARRDLSDIWYYTESRWGAEQAERYTRQIEHDLTAAAAGSPLVRPFGRHLRVRSGHHLCILRRTDGGDVIVVRILHERMDVPAQLGE